MVETTPRTTTRKPRTRAAVSGDVPKPAVKRIVRKPKSGSVSVARKAPTTIPPVRKKSSTMIYVGAAIFVLMFGTSAVIGFTSEGQINVGNTIIAQGGGHYTAPDGTQVAMPPQQNQQPINSGLVPSAAQPATPPPPVETTSSTEEAASSTETATSSTESSSDEATSAEGTAQAGDVAGVSMSAEETQPQ